MIGEVVGWVIGEVVGELLGAVWPKRVSGRAVLASCAVTAGLMWATMRWWQADPASDARTTTVGLSWLLLPAIPIMLALQYDAGVQERRRLRRESAGAGLLRNQRLRER